MQHIGGGMWSNLISAAASSQGSAERGGGTPARKSHRCPGQPNWCGDTAQSYLDDRILCHRTKKKKKERRYESLPLGDVERVHRTEIFGLLLEIADWGTTVPESHRWTQCHPIPVLVQFVAKQQCYFLGVLNIHRSLGTIRARHLHLKFGRTNPLARPCCKYFSCRREIERLSAEL